MPEVTIQLPPGVAFSASKARKSASWREVNLMRWDEGTMLPIGGWQSISMSGFASRIRKIHRWMANDNTLYTAYLCEQHCYVEIKSALVDITPVGGMPPIPTNTGGYGSGSYGSSTYGTPRPGTLGPKVYSPAFSADNWGEELRVMTSADGRLLEWLPSTPATPLVAVVGAPVDNRSFVITPERHIILFDAGGVLGKFDWCDQEDDTDWVPSLTSRAGSLTVSPKSPIVAVQRTSDGTFISTMDRHYIIQYKGLPFVYGFTDRGEAPVPISAAAIADIPDGVVWPSLEGFWLYNGSSIQPVECPVWDWVTARVDFPNTVFNSAVIDVNNKSELWWFFVDIASPPYNSLFVALDYRNNNWSMGKLARSCGMAYSNDRYPIMADGQKLYKHEVGFEYGGAPELPWAETFTMNMLDGHKLMAVKDIQPEIIGDASKLNFRVAMITNRADQSSERFSIPRKVRSNGVVDIRETARDFRLRVDMVAGSGSWTMGPVIVDVAAKGKSGKRNA